MTRLRGNLTREAALLPMEAAQGGAHSGGCTRWHTHWSCAAGSGGGATARRRKLTRVTPPSPPPATRFSPVTPPLLPSYPLVFGSCSCTRTLGFFDLGP
jgi:hypothetical protein